MHVLSTLNAGPVVWLPTADLRGRDLLETLLSSVPGSMVLPGGDPDAMWSIVGRLRALVTPTLHGACFAYAQRIPFLTFGYGSELGDFLRDRAGHCRFRGRTQRAYRLRTRLQRGIVRVDGQRERGVAQGVFVGAAYPSVARQAGQALQ